jgi:hypothetical protein
MLKERIPQFEFIYRGFFIEPPQAKGVFFSRRNSIDRLILEVLSAGDTSKEIVQRQKVTPACLKSLRHDLTLNAIEYLV